MKYAPIIVLIVLALGVAAVTIYRPHGRPRVHSIGVHSIGPGYESCIGFLTVGPMPADKVALEET